MPRGLHRVMLKMHLLSLGMLLRRSLSAVQQWNKMLFSGSEFGSDHRYDSVANVNRALIPVSKFRLRYADPQWSPGHLVITYRSSFRTIVIPVPSTTSLTRSGSTLLVVHVIKS